MSIIRSYRADSFVMYYSRQWKLSQSYLQTLYLFIEAGKK